MPAGHGICHDSPDGNLGFHRNITQKSSGRDTSQQVLMQRFWRRPSRGHMDWQKKSAGKPAGHRRCPDGILTDINMEGEGLCRYQGQCLP